MEATQPPVVDPLLEIRQKLVAKHKGLQLSDFFNYKTPENKTKERQQEILDLIAKHKGASVTAFAPAFGLTPCSIERWKRPVRHHN
jgi:hypothetical protein